MGYERDLATGASELKSYPIPTQLTPTSPSAGTSADLVSALPGLQAIIDALPQQIAVLDSRWVIVAINRSWKRAINAYGHELGPGANYLQFCLDFAEEGFEPARKIATAMQEIEAGKRTQYKRIYQGRDRWQDHSFLVRLSKLRLADQELATVTRYDITELIELRRMRRRLGSSLMEGQKEERRRLGREIHNSTAQLMVGLKLSVMRMKSFGLARRYRPVLNDMEEILDEMQKGIRSFAYLAHPPFLARMTIAEAITALAEGFSRRSGIGVQIDIDGCPGAITAEAKEALYRLVQEALSNVYAHAHATQVAVCLSGRREMVHIVISDNGVGMPACRTGEAQIGVGISGMQARLEDLGGRLTIRDLNPGTEIIGSLPNHPVPRTNGDLALPV